MKKRTKIICIVAAIMLVAVVGLTGCGLSQTQAKLLQMMLANQSAQTETEETESDQEIAFTGKQSTAENTGSVTVFVYMNGSDLESEDGAATEDIQEMVDAGDLENVNVLIETVGTSQWDDTFDISADRTQIFKVENGNLVLVNDNLDQEDATDPDTLEEFIEWGNKNYPADRNILVMWDHGGGAVYGFGYDENVSDEEAALTLDEIQSAVKEAGVHFDFIGMDACIMSTIEVAAALDDYCDYTILSEDFESDIGWSYTEWMKALDENTEISTTELGKIIVDSMVEANANYDYSEEYSDDYYDDYSDEDSDMFDFFGGSDESEDHFGGPHTRTHGSEDDEQYESEEYEVSGILCVIDESKIDDLFEEWIRYAYANEESILNANVSTEMTTDVSGRVLPRLVNKDFFDWFEDLGDVTIAEYGVNDIANIISEVGDDDALTEALNNAIVYVNSTGEEQELCGLAVTLPYGDSYMYEDLEEIFKNCGFDSEYVEWLENFTSADSSYDSDSLFGDLFGDDDDSDWFEDSDDSSWYEDDSDDDSWFWGDDEDSDWYDDDENEGGDWYSDIFEMFFA